MVKARNVPIAEATGIQIMAAAYRLLNTCVRDGNGQAGVFKGIGNHGHSSVRPYIYTH